MRLVRARLARHGTEQFEGIVRSEIPIGAMYTVDLATTRKMTYKHGATGETAIVQAAIVRDDATGTFGYFQLALLDLDEGVISLEDHLKATIQPIEEVG